MTLDIVTDALTMVWFRGLLAPELLQHALFMESEIPRVAIVPAASGSAASWAVISACCAIATGTHPTSAASNKQSVRRCFMRLVSMAPA